MLLLGYSTAVVPQRRQVVTPPHPPIAMLLLGYSTAVVPQRRQEQVKSLCRCVQGWLQQHGLCVWTEQQGKIFTMKGLHDDSGNTLLLFVAYLTLRLRPQTENSSKVRRTGWRASQSRIIGAATASAWWPGV